MLKNYRYDNYKDVVNALKIPGEFVKCYIKKVLYNGTATIVFWSDGTKTISVCGKNDTYDQEKGLLICIFRKYFPMKNTNKLFELWTNNNKEGTITIKEVRKKEKENG